VLTGCRQRHRSDTLPVFITAAMWQAVAPSLPSSNTGMRGSGTPPCHGRWRRPCIFTAGSSFFSPAHLHLVDVAGDFGCLLAAGCWLLAAGCWLLAACVAVSPVPGAQMTVAMRLAGLQPGSLGIPGAWLATPPLTCKAVPRSLLAPSSDAWCWAGRQASNAGYPGPCIGCSPWSCRLRCSSGSQALSFCGAPARHAC